MRGGLVYICFFLFFAFSVQAKIVDKIDSYGVEDVVVIIDNSIQVEDSVASIEERLLLAAKQKAFLELREYLGMSVLDVEDDTLNSLIVGFAPSNVVVDGLIYATKYTIIFDKLLLRDLKTKSNNSSDGVTFITTRFSVHGRLKSWLLMRERLLSMQINYHVIFLTTDYVDIGFMNVDQESLLLALSKVGISFVRNGDINFIKPSLFS